MRVIRTSVLTHLALLCLVVAQTDPEIGQLSLWDVGFSLQREWGALLDQQAQEQACLAPDQPSEPSLQASDVSVEAEKEQKAEPVVHANAPVVSQGDDIVSFEEWKRIKQADAAVTEEPSTNHGDHSNVQVNTSEEPQKPVDEKVAETVVEEPKKPAHHKYNYASPDCSARIHSASPQTQHASSLLHKSRDRYMLTPCRADQHWVVVELCDEIRIEAVEIAVWEFFSSVVREVKVSVDEDGDANQWKEVASFVGKNVRGVQVRYAGHGQS